MATNAGIVVYVRTGTLFERVLPPLPHTLERHCVSSAYWNIVMTQDGRLAAFVRGAAAPTALDYRDARSTLTRSSDIRGWP